MGEGATGRPARPVELALGYLPGPARAAPSLPEYGGSACTRRRAANAPGGALSAASSLAPVVGAGIALNRPRPPACRR